TKAITALHDENASLRKRLEKFEAAQLKTLQETLAVKTEDVNGIRFLGEVVNVPSADALKKLAFALKGGIPRHAIALAAAIEGKASIVLLFDDTVAAEKGLDAAALVKQVISPLIKGGGGGQKTLATAGGQDISNLRQVIAAVKAAL
ncbi:MAG TPA: DHHA1 domain-containing protein, partial [Flavisolibacter sp.]|nr:DHHA1 domain-containing protein [Flavisolibacter sp.]